MSDSEELRLDNSTDSTSCPGNNQEKMLEEIAAELVMVTPEDLPGLARLHDLFLRLIKAINDKSAPTAIMAERCADYIEKIVLKEIDGERGLNLINDAVAGLQKIIRDHRNVEDIEFPDIFAAGDEAKSGSGYGMEKFPSDCGRQLSMTCPGEKEQSEPAEAEQVVLTNLVINIQNSDTSLLPEFVSEAREHCTTAESSLMDLENEADNDDAINAIFRSFHTIKGAAGFLEIKPIMALAHESETLLDLARKQKIKMADHAADLIFESIDVMRELLDALEELMKTGGEYDATDTVSSLVERLRFVIADPGAIDEDNTRLGDLLIDMGVVSETDVNDALSDKMTPVEKLGEALVRRGKTNERAIDHALRDQHQVRRESAFKDKVRIDTDRLDRLVDTIGELVIAESMVGQDDEILAMVSTKMAKNISHLNKITRELQEMGMAMRLVPVKAAFQKLARTVRDMAHRSGKKVNLELSGEDSEVDRSIVENIGDPLMHMVRNSVDHGLETPGERADCGKPETGNIWIRAYHKGGNIYFEIEDDGRGLDRQKILAAARDKGLAPYDKELSDKEIYNFILNPGFTTASNITDVSGRGVGMDVVKKNIDAMRGYLEIESEPGRGTKFTMKLPLTLAIIDGMLVSVGDEEYIIPTLSVVESLQISDEIVSTVTRKGEIINLRGEILPLFRLRSLFDLPASNNADADSTIVIVDDMEQRVGLLVDKLLGQSQTVIKSLGRLFERQKWISGGAILSDGSIGLIIDVSGIIKLARSIGGDSDNLIRREQKSHKLSKEFGENTDTAALESPPDTETMVSSAAPVRDMGSSRRLPIK